MNKLIHYALVTGLDNSMYIGREINWWIIMTSANLYEANICSWQLAAKWAFASVIFRICVYVEIAEMPPLLCDYPFVCKYYGYLTGVPKSIWIVLENLSTFRMYVSSSKNTYASTYVHRIAAQPYPAYQLSDCEIPLKSGNVKYVTYMHLV